MNALTTFGSRQGQGHGQGSAGPAARSCPFLWFCTVQQAQARVAHACTLLHPSTRAGSLPTTPRASGLSAAETGDRAPLRPPVSPCMTYAEDPRRADRGSPSSPTAAGGSKGPSTRCPRTPGVPCFFTCSRRRSFMAGSSARSEGTSPSLFTTATLAPWPRKYLWAREPGSVVPLPPSTGSRVRARGSTQSEACLGCRVPPRRCSA